MQLTATVLKFIVMAEWLMPSINKEFQVENHKGLTYCTHYPVQTRTLVPCWNHTTTTGIPMKGSWTEHNRPCGYFERPLTCDIYIPFYIFIYIMHIYSKDAKICSQPPNNYDYTWVRKGLLWRHASIPIVQTKTSQNLPGKATKSDSCRQNPQVLTCKNSLTLDPRTRKMVS